jgi:hypothetical protein
MGQKPITGSNPVISAITHVKAGRTGYLKLRTGNPFAIGELWRLPRAARGGNKSHPVFSNRFIVFFPVTLLNEITEGEGE